MVVAPGVGGGNALSAKSLFAAVGAVASGVGLLAATGLLGRIERDHTAAFSAALGLTAGGTFLIALATSGVFVGKLKVAGPILRGIGGVAVCAGVILAAVVAVVTASDHGEPVIDVAVTP